MAIMAIEIIVEHPLRHALMGKMYFKSLPSKKRIYIKSSKTKSSPQFSPYHDKPSYKCNLIFSEKIKIKELKQIER